MPYPINRTDGSLLVNIQDYTRDTITTSLTLLGRGVVNYGEGVAENLVHMLEHFAGPTPPNSPLEGQLWFQTFDPGPPARTINKVRVWNGIAWVTVGGVANGVDAPKNPELGDLWFNPATKLIYFWDGDKWKWIGGPAVEEPTNPQEGQLWWMIPERQLWAYDATLTGTRPPNAKRLDGSDVPKGWVLVGPLSPKQSGTYIEVEGNVTVGGSKVDLLKIWVDNLLVAVWTDKSGALDPAWEPSFNTYNSSGASVHILQQGLNMNNTAGMLLNGTATNSDLLDGIDSASFFRRDKSDWPQATDILDAGQAANRWRRNWSRDYYGANSDTQQDDISRISFHGMSSKAAKSDAADKLAVPRDLIADPTGDIAGKFDDFDGSKDVTGIFLLTDAAFAKIIKLIKDNQPPAPSTNYIKTDGNSKPTADNTFIIGEPGAKFKSMYCTDFIGTAMNAKYADLAERYEADAEYAPGTLVRIGGSKEVTQTTERLDIDVFGVVSTAPAYLMNSEAGSNATHPPIAFSGRVPVRVVGPVTKGQRLVASATPGTAEGWTGNKLMLTPFSVVGRALEDKTSTGEALVLAVVGAK